MTPGVATTREGDRQLTAMPSSYTSAASPLVNRSRAALHMPYMVPPRLAMAGYGGPFGWNDDLDEMFRIHPRRRARIPGSTMPASSNGARTRPPDSSSPRPMSEAATWESEV